MDEAARKHANTIMEITRDQTRLIILTAMAKGEPIGPAIVDALTYCTRQGSKLVGQIDSFPSLHREPSYQTMRFNAVEMALGHIYQPNGVGTIVEHIFMAGMAFGFYGEKLQ